jgi:hypothetical protein
MSLRQTTAAEQIDLSEWMCVVDSVVKIEVEQLEDLRSFKIKTLLASGDFDVQQFKIPAMLNAGVYKNGQSYERGDVVTRDGSQWVCEVDQTSAVPAFSRDWRLCVRKGESAKEQKTNTNNGAHKPISLK